MINYYRYRSYALAQSKKISDRIAITLAIITLTICVCPIAWYFLDRDCDSILHHLWYIIKSGVLVVLAFFLAVVIYAFTSRVL